MTDHFATLGMPRRPWLDEELLKSRFHELSRQFHPDRVHSQAAAELAAANQQSIAVNTAHATLSEPKERLAHLLELESGTKPRVVQDIPADLMNLCMEVGTVCRQADDFLVDTPESDSPMLRVQRFTRAMAQREKVGALLGRLHAQTAKLREELKVLDQAWDAAAGENGQRQLPWDRVEQLWRLFSYLGRWTSQLQDRNVRLMI